MEGSSGCFRFAGNRWVISGLKPLEINSGKTQKGEARFAGDKNPDLLYIYYTLSPLMRPYIYIKCSVYAR